MKVRIWTSKIGKERKVICQENATHQNRSLTPLREAEVLLSQGSTAAEATRHLGIAEQTYYKWRKEYGGMRINQAKRLKELEKENTRLKNLHLLSQEVHGKMVILNHLI